MLCVVWFTALGIVVVVLTLIGYALHRASVYAGRGWIHNKHNPRPRGSGTLGLLEQIYQPGIEHVSRRDRRSAHGPNRSSPVTNLERDPHPRMPDGLLTGRRALAESDWCAQRTG